MSAYLVVYQETIGNKTRQVNAIVVCNNKSQAELFVRDTVDGAFSLVALKKLDFSDVYHLNSWEVL